MAATPLPARDGSAFANAPAALVEHAPLVMGDLLFGGTIRSWIGFDRRPARRGSRATIHHGQRLRSGGREICGGPSWRMVTDIAQPMLRTALPGGPTGFVSTEPPAAS